LTVRKARKEAWRCPPQPRWARSSQTRTTSLKFRVVDADFFSVIHSPGQVPRVFCWADHVGIRERSSSPTMSRDWIPRQCTQHSPPGKKKSRIRARVEEQLHHIELSVRLLRGGVVLTVPAAQTAILRSGIATAVGPALLRSRWEIPRER
jgi:hypothetical protein